MSGSYDVAVGTCLQCEQTPAQVKREQTICGVEDGYEYRELVAEWPRHHWRDWSDAELRDAGIHDHAFDRYRRCSVFALGYAQCDDTRRGHNVCKHDDDEWGMERGQCWDCGRRGLPVPEAQGSGSS